MRKREFWNFDLLKIENFDENHRKLKITMKKIPKIKKMYRKTTKIENFDREITEIKEKSTKIKVWHFHKI